MTTGTNHEAGAEVEQEAGAPPAASTEPRWRRTLRVFSSNKLALAGLVFFALVVIAALFGPWIAPYDATQVSVTDRLQAPSLAHPFGTDDLGRDVLSRVILGSRVSMIVGLIAVGIALTGGTIVGLLAGFFGGKLDDVLMRCMDVIFSFPAVLMAIVVLAILGSGTVPAAIALGVVFIPIFARIARSSVLSVREEVYVRAARSAGASNGRLIRLHVLPNIAASLIVQTTISLAFAILNEAALAFLGLSTQPPTPSWGRMLSEARGYMEDAIWIALFPGLAIFFTVFAFNVMGDALRDALDPRQASTIESRSATA